MMREKLIGAATLLLVMLFAPTEASVQPAVAQQPAVERPVVQPPPVSTFKAGIDSGAGERSRARSQGPVRPEPVPSGTSRSSMAAKSGRSPIFATTWPA